MHFWIFLNLWMHIYQILPHHVTLIPSQQSAKAACRPDILSDNRVHFKEYDCAVTHSFLKIEFYARLSFGRRKW